MVGIFNSSIFNNAIFNTDSPAVEETTGDSWIQYDPSALRATREMQAAKKRERIKQDEIIAKRLEAQELLLRKRELQDLQDKQSLRQMAFLEREYLELQNEIMAQMAALEILQKQAIQRRKAVTFLLMMAASPFTSLSLH